MYMMRAHEGYEVFTWRRRGMGVGIGLVDGHRGEHREGRGA